jgi:hypothetical protein
MIFNIRGTNGSGKSTIVRAYMSTLNELEPVTEVEKGKAIGYKGYNKTGNTVSIVGRYETDCGGCDTIKTQDLVGERVKNAAHFGHAVFEGVIVGDIWGRWKAFADEYQQRTGDMFIFAYLDTPLELCIERVSQRRRKAGKDPYEFNTALVEQKYNNAKRQLEKAQREGANWLVLSHDKAVEEMSELLETGT